MAQICQIVDKHSLLLSILHWNNGYFSVTLLTPSLKSILPFCRTLFYRPIVPFCWTLSTDLTIALLSDLFLQTYLLKSIYCPSVRPYSTDPPLKSIFPFLRTESDVMENKKAFHGRMSNFYINQIDLSTYEERNKKKTGMQDSIRSDKAHNILITVHLYIK